MAEIPHHTSFLPSFLSKLLFELKVSLCEKIADTQKLPASSDVMFCALILSRQTSMLQRFDLPLYTCFFFPSPPVASMPPPPPSLSRLSEEELRELEAEGRRGLEARLQCLQNIHTLLDAAMLNIHHYLSTVATLR